MPDKKILVVFGATGVQGGSVIDAVLADRDTAATYRIRAVTRDPSKANAQALTARGVDCVKADLGSKASLKAAFEGASAVFAVTSYWESMDREVEVQQGKNIADAARDSGIEHLVWSTLMNVNKLSGGKFAHVAHFDAKDEVAQYIRALGVPATFFMPGFYMQNISGGMLMRKDAGGTYRLTFPAPGHTLVPLLDARADTGKYVKAALKKAALTLGREIYGAPAYITIQDAVAAVARIHPDTAAGASFTEVSADDYRAGLTGSGLPDHAAQELLENMQFMTEYGYFGQKDLAWSNQILDEKASTWEEFLKTVQL